MPSMGVPGGELRLCMVPEACLCLSALQSQLAYSVAAEYPPQMVMGREIAFQGSCLDGSERRPAITSGKMCKDLWSVKRC